MTTTTQLATRSGGGQLRKVQPSDPAVLALPGTESIWVSIKQPATRGMRLIVVFFGTFVVWGSFAPLDGGAIAPGIVSLDGSKKTVQHLEGGIIAKLNVREGDVVQLGQTLLVLENVQPRTVFESLQQEGRTLAAVRARLEAEKIGLAEPSFPASLTSAEDQGARRIVEDQAHLFKTRLEMHRARLDVLSLRMAQIKEQAQGYVAQVTSADRQLELIADEVTSKTHLFAKNLVSKPELLKLERAEAEIGGRRGEALAGISRAMQQIGEAQSQRLALEAERSDQVANQLDDVRRRLAEVEQKLDASRDILHRTLVTAPTEGIVLNMKFKTAGGVVIKGEPIMDIVPLNDGLLIDARISPNDIDIVRVGLPALVHLTAYSSRSTQKVNGVVKLLSADRLTDEATKQSYFLARIAVAKGEVEALTPKVELIPGMSAEVMIVTEQRTLLRYLMQPFLDAMRRSFREA